MSDKYIIAVDLGATNLKIGLFDYRFKLRQKSVLNTKNFSNKEELIFAITDAVGGIMKDNKLEKRDILGLGLGVPGPVDNLRGIVHFFPNIPGWRQVNLRQILNRKLGLPVSIDNDANLMALAEYRLGAARGAKIAVCLTLGTGVGGGIIIGGKIYRGKNNASAEIGHIPINEKGPRCNCGGRACLEAYIGNKRIAAQAEKVFKRHICLEELSESAKRGNKLALSIWSGVARHLAVALVGVVNLLNPDCIVIGGGIANAGRLLFDEIRKIILAQAMPVQAEDVKIFKAKLGPEAGLIGAAIMVKEGGLEQ